MSRAFVCLVAFLTLASAWPVSSQPPAPTQPARDTPAAATGGTAVIRGRVLDAASGRGLSRVTVRANTNGPQPPGVGPMALTDASGRYEITGLAANTYTVAAT